MKLYNTSQCKNIAMVSSRNTQSKWLTDPRIIKQAHKIAKQNGSKWDALIQ